MVASIRVALCSRSSTAPRESRTPKSWMYTLPSPSNPVGTSSTTRRPSASRIGMNADRSTLPPVLYNFTRVRRSPGGLVPQADDEPLVLLLQLVELEDVVDDQVPVAVRLVVVGEPGRVPVGQRFAALGTHARDQRIPEIVVPGSSEPFDLLLELLVRDLGDLDTGIHVHGEEDPGVLRLSERQVVVDGGAMEPLLEQLLQALAQVRVEAIPRKGHDDRDAPAVEIPTDEHADAAVALQLEEPADQTDGARPSMPGTARPWGTIRTSVVAAL